ncbi:MAG: Tyrosine--tRNA ligase [bacterium ADurb.Bin212]|nr:MAG: Tyrosine--tRNA ligase [bacterium ADurb.Bin212]
MLNILGKGVERVISSESLEQRIKGNKKLRIKYGVDPSSSDIHLGHAVALWQLKRFQDAGHKVIFLIGDYTAMIGDPSGKNKTRPVLTEDQILSNSKTYLDQVAKILDLNKIEVRRNSEWFKKINMQDLIRLGSNFSVASIIERDDFEKRLKNGLEISMHELFYPMMQAYDSVMLEADVEIGGTDQMFNMLAGRELQKKIGQTPQEVIMTGLLVGLDGKEKMSKSLGNYIGVAEKPNDQFGKIMSIPDELIIKYFELCTGVDEEVLKRSVAEMSQGANPRDYKEALAMEIVTIYHGKKEAEKAKEAFIKQFRQKELPENIEEIKISGDYDLLLLVNNLSPDLSNSEIRRLINQGAVKVDGAKIDDEKARISVHDGMIVQIGKRKHWKIVS